MTGYPWATGDALLAADLNAAFASGVGIAGGPFLPLSGGTVTGVTTVHHDMVFTPATTQPAFQVYGAMSGTMGAVGAVSPFNLTVTSNTINSTANPGSSFFAANMIHNFGGTKGGVGTLNVSQTQTADILDTTSAFINAANIYLDIEHSGNNLGNAIGAAIGVNYGAAASGWNAETLELGLTRAAGSTVIEASVIGIAYTNSATTHASSFETAIGIMATPGNVTGLNNLISVGRAGAQWPLDPNGWIFQTAQQTNNNPGNTQRWPQRCAGGFDFSKVNFSAAALRTQGVSIGGAQLAVMGGSNFFTDTNGLVIDSVGSIGFVTGVTTAGAGYQVNDQLYDGIGGILLVSAVGGGGAITTVNYIVGKEPYNFGSPPTSVTPTGGSGSGAVIGIAWATRQTLTLNKSGGTTNVGGIISGPTATFNQCNVGAGGPSITTGNGVPAATMPVSSLYLRTGGAAGSRLYVSAGGGTWAAVAGV